MWERDVLIHRVDIDALVAIDRRQKRIEGENETAERWRPRIIRHWLCLCR